MAIPATFNYLYTIFTNTYRWLNENFVPYILMIVKGFETGIIVISVLIFLGLTFLIVIKKYRNLPKSYNLEIFKNGKKASIKGIRRVFARRDVAESYATHYKDIFKQYEFRIKGSKKKYKSKLSQVLK